MEREGGIFRKKRVCRRRDRKNGRERQAERDRDVQVQERRTRIRESRYNGKYEKIITEELPKYLGRESRKERVIIARFIVDSSCKKPLVICNSIFSIFLNQIKAQRDQKIIVWIEYFPYKYSFKVISND
jgi:hypothetical protein